MKNHTQKIQIQITNKNIAKTKQTKQRKMHLNQVSSSTKIYNDQINIYIQTGQGYQQLRVHLLTELNQLDPGNPNSDETLVPSLTDNLRICLLTESSQLKSRTIDVIQDIIKYADEVVDSFFTSKDFTIATHTAITYRLFNPFSKALFDENKLRLCSIVLFYHQKFQQDPSRYFHIFQLYKQLKQRNVTFPPKTFIEIPKVNEFKKPKINKKSSEKGSQNDKIGVTFDSIIEFVQDCEKQFNRDKASCANTQFVRALKVKAKTLFDLSQNNQDLDLSSKEKEHAKQLYKQIRTILKEIEKISEEKIKQQKIKSEKQFAMQKMEQISPNKKRQSGMGSSQKSINESVKQQQKVRSFDLLDGVISLQSVQTKESPSPLKKAESSAKVKKETNLLDDDFLGQDENGQSQFTDYTSGTDVNPLVKSPSKQQIPFQGFKPIKKPPKHEETNTVFNFDQLIDAIEPSSIQKAPSIQQDFNLIQTVVNQPQFQSKKSVKSMSKHSVRSEQSDKPVNLLGSEPNTLLFKQQDIHNLQFENAQHFSKFQVVNNYLDPNKYGQIPMDIDFSDSSSQQSAESQRVTFELANNNNKLFETKNQPYDQTFRTPKKQTSYHQAENQQKNIEKLSLSANIIKQKQELIPNQNFGILADMREVKAYDYNQFQNTKAQRSSISNVSEEERTIELTPKSNKKILQGGSMNELSPDQINFNSQKKKTGNELLGQNEDGGNDEFGSFQEIPSTPGFGIQGIAQGIHGLAQGIQGFTQGIQGLKQGLTQGIQGISIEGIANLGLGLKAKIFGEGEHRTLVENSPQKGDFIDDVDEGTLHQGPVLNSNAQSIEELPLQKEKPVQKQEQVVNKELLL